MEVRNGVAFLDPEIEKWERDVFIKGEMLLLADDWECLSIPSLITRDTIERQGVVSWDHTLKINDQYALSGSAEQGILEYLKGKHTPSRNLYARNQCFRNEPQLDGLMRLREFNKLEMFTLSETRGDALRSFENCLRKAETLLTYYGLQIRRVDLRHEHGYHSEKVDLEVLTQKYGWMETHSCTYFGEEQARRFDITGATHTVSCTMAASPRILIPILEAMGYTLP